MQRKRISTSIQRPHLRRSEDNNGISLETQGGGLQTDTGNSKRTFSIHTPQRSVLEPPEVGPSDIDWEKDVFRGTWKQHPHSQRMTSSVGCHLEGPTAETDHRQSGDRPKTRSRGRSPTPRARSSTQEFVSPIPARADGARGDSQQSNVTKEAPPSGPATLEALKYPIKEADKVRVEDWPQVQSFHQWKLAF